MIDDNVMFVKEFGLFSTTSRRVDWQEIVVPNSILANSRLVHNVRRSVSVRVIISSGFGTRVLKSGQVGIYKPGDLL
jgi:small-conductance mechanosensitive channel